MSPEEREGNDTLESLIATYLQAEKSGQSLDHDGLIEEYPDLADSLQEFFANHDRMKGAASLEEPTLPPNGSGLDDPTIPPGQGSREDATMPPQTAGDDPTIPPIERTSQPAEPAVGDQVRYFGDYELLQEIARGGMGVVFKARQINLNRTVALKMILAGQFAGEEDVQRFYTEAEAAAALDHPGIVPIFEIGELHLWDSESGEKLAALAWIPIGPDRLAPWESRLGKHAGNVTAVAFSPTGDMIASGSFDGTVKVWDVGTEKSPLLPFR